MKNFIFDLYNTLISIHTDEGCERTWLPVAGFFAERGLSVERWETLRDWYHEIFSDNVKELKAEGKYEYPEGDIIEVFRRMAKRLGGDWDRETAGEAATCMRRASIEHIYVFDGVQKLFAELRARGAKIFLLSNAQAILTRYELEECGLSEDKFDGMLLSSECGCRKPDKKFFEMLFDKYGLEKADSVMVGDDRWSDGKGAKAFGIKYVFAEHGAPAVASKLISLAEK